MGVRTISKTIDLSQLPKESKYITEINDTGITIHPKVYNGSSSIERSSYIQLDGTGMELFNSSGISIAKYGEDIRLGNVNEGKLLITAGGQGRTYEDAGTYIIDENDNISAQFLEDGTTIYGPSNTLIAHLGYGPGTDSGGGTSDAPYYTLGERLINSTIGNFSIASGLDADANGYCSYVEGMRNTSNGEACHAEGYFNTADGFASHVEGQENTADNGAHAEGYHGSATGVYSHTQNLRTVAGYNYQTAIGKYNDNQSANAFEIGNGTAENARSNALTVGWDGNVWCAGGITATPTAITLTYSQCTTGSYTRCYRIGNIVFLSFNINVTTATASYDYITDLPPALGGGWAASSGFGSGAMTRWWITTSGTLRADGTPTAGWHNGSVVYICQ